MWQKCPICNGDGFIPTSGSSTSRMCPTCKGMRIISESTGLPPWYEPALPNNERSQPDHKEHIWEEFDENGKFKLKES